MFDTLPTMMGYWDNNSEDSSTISSLGTLSGDYEGGLAGQGLYCFHQLCSLGGGLAANSSHKSFGRWLANRT